MTYALAHAPHGIALPFAAAIAVLFQFLKENDGATLEKELAVTKC